MRWLRDALWSEVMSGGFSGGLFPREADLMKSYGASRSTVREAIDLLRREGIVERIQGTGTLAVAHRNTMKLVEAHGFGDSVQRAMPGTASRVLAHEIVPMPRAAARRLACEPGEDALLIEYVGYQYGQILGLYSNYVRFPQAESVRTTPFRTHWYALLEKAGITIGETDFLIEVMAADQLLAGILEMEVGRPVLAMEQVIRDDAGDAFNYAVLRSRGDRMSVLSQAISPTFGIRKG
ncbi:GntR family transcriptional regulator [Nocardioides humi]|uniref:GntR family transcriptional regulator n=1 Tax=Nocardioides humi TaxID=449461 RepID=A0ABN1ZTY3_9ACTN